jgi:hypothetical protein
MSAKELSAHQVVEFDVSAEDVAKRQSLRAVPVGDWEY